MPTLTDAERNALALEYDETAKRSAADFFRRNREWLDGSTWDFDELFQTARLVLLTALEEYNPARGTIKNYLFTCCMRELRRAVDMDHRGIRIPYWAASCLRGKTWGRLNDTPLKQRATANLEALATATHAGLDCSRGIADHRTADPEDAATLRELREMIFELPAKEWEVVHRHFGFCGDDMTFQEIGAVMGMSHTSAQNRKNDGIRRLRRRYFWAGLANA